MRANTLHKIQTIGTVTVFALIAASGVVAFSLAAAPDSPALWFLDREVFGVVRSAHWPLAILPLMGPAAAWLGLAGILLALASHWKRWAFVAALLSHACYALIAQPAYAWAFAGPNVRTASLIPIEISTEASIVTWLSIGATILSVVACHLTYLLGAYARFRKRPA